MSALRHLPGVIVAELGVPDPGWRVSVCAASLTPVQHRSFASADEARAFARHLAERCGLLLIDRISATEGDEE